MPSSLYSYIGLSSLQVVVISTPLVLYLAIHNFGRRESPWTTFFADTIWRLLLLLWSKVTIKCNGKQSRRGYCDTITDGNSFSPSSGNTTVPNKTRRSVAGQEKLQGVC